MNERNDKDRIAQQLREIAAGADGECWGPWEDVSEILLEAAALLTPPAGPDINQCDGCRRGLPLRRILDGKPDRGTHYDPETGLPVMSCTADRYAASHGPDINQCDGCRRGLPLRRTLWTDGRRDRGTHYDPETGLAVMCCTADRYVVFHEPEINDAGFERWWARLPEVASRLVDANIKPWAQKAWRVCASASHLTPEERDHLIEWHESAAKLSDQSDDFNGVAFHQRRARDLRALSAREESR